MLDSPSYHWPVRGPRAINVEQNTLPCVSFTFLLPPQVLILGLARDQLDPLLIGFWWE